VIVILSVGSGLNLLPIAEDSQILKSKNLLHGQGVINVMILVP
jgi:hypothetical protein